MPTTEYVGVIDSNDNLAAIDVDGNIHTIAQSSFSRIKASQFKNDEEVRYDIPADTANDSIYTGLAPSGTAVSTTDWDIVRTKFDGNGNPTRDQIKTNVAWDNRDNLSW